MNINRIFEIAKKLAKKSDHPRYRLGCVLMNKKHVIGLGFNAHRTHPKSPHKYKHIHAEFSAILGCEVSDLRDSVAYVYRENRNGVIGMAKPCPTCHKMLQDVGVKRIYYTDKDGYKSFDL